MGSLPGNPPDRWAAVQLPDQATSESILMTLNNQKSQVTAAFVQQCPDGLFLFLGFYTE